MRICDVCGKPVEIRSDAVMIPEPYRREGIEEACPACRAALNSIVTVHQAESKAALAKAIGDDWDCFLADTKAATQVDAEEPEPKEKAEVNNGKGPN